MKFVLSLLIDSLLILHHLFTLASPEFIKCSSVLGSLADANTFVSSAKILKLNFCELHRWNFTPSFPRPSNTSLHSSSKEPLHGLRKP